MKILLLPDKINWAFHSIALALRKYNKDPDVKISIAPIKGNVPRIKRRYKRYDRFLVMGWQNYKLVKFLPKHSTFVGLHSHHSWDKRRTTPEKDVVPPGRLIDLLSSFKGVNAVSLRLFNLFKKGGVHNLVYTPNGVDTQLFKDLGDFS